MTISIVTPWLDHPELIPAYEAAVQGAEVTIVDTGSTPSNHQKLGAMVDRLGGLCVLFERETFSFAAACNVGFFSRTLAADGVCMFLNNDISAAPGWLAAVERDVLANPGALLGPATDVRGLAGRAMVYVEGWCIAARGQTWERLVLPRQNGPWDADSYPRPYWEDVDLSWRAVQAGLRLRRRDWKVAHISNVTSDSVPGAKAATDANRDRLEARIAAADAAQGVVQI